MFVKLDFEKVYQVESEKRNEGFFYTVLRNGKKKRIKIQIADKPQPLLDGAYNLAFGPVDRKGRIKDMVSVKHTDYSMVFSTILKFAKDYLEWYPYHMVGLDGSTNSRAYVYFRMIKQNYDFLSERFDMYGIKYYMRVKRKGPELYDNPFDATDVACSYYKLLRNELDNNRDLEKMFNYFVFKNNEKYD